MRQLAIRVAAALAMLCVVAGAAQAQRVRLELQESGQVNVGAPFVLALVAEGFDGSPEPTVSKFEIAGASVSYLGNAPRVMSTRVRRNGRISVQTRTTHVFTFQITATHAGTFRVPALTVTQGKRSARTRPSRFVAKAVPNTPYMRLLVRIPDRPIWVGEVFELYVDWYLSRDPGDQVFSIPLFQQTDVFTVKKRGTGRRVVAFAYGTEKLELPYEQSTETLDGTQFTRLRFKALVIPKKAGVLALPGAQVIARLQTGWGRDGLGFRTRRYGRFKAVDKPRTIDVRPLPVQDRPAGFDNAVGTQFSIQVSAARTVVRVGDPVELTIDVRSGSPVEGLILPGLSGDHALPTDKFTVPDESPTGELLPDGKTKRFRVTARVKSARVTEIPAIAFSYFDPTKSKYLTIRSQPIALSVQGGAVVGAKDVVGGAKRAPGGATRRGGIDDALMSLIGADMSLSSPGATMRRVSGMWDLRWILALLYGVPLLLFGLRLVQLRTRTDRAEGSELRARRRALSAALEDAETLAAREAAPKIISSLRALARTTELDGDVYRSLLEDLETGAFNPKAADRPLEPGLRDRVRDVVAQSVAGRRRARRGGSAKTTAALVLLGATGLVAASTVAAMSPGDELSGARDTYQKALRETAREARTSGFLEAEAMYRGLVARRGDRPELLTDWGNAALGAHDLGRATLAYRRALRLDRRLTRASRNLSWVRDRAPAWLPRVEQHGAMDSLFFWHRRFTPTQRHLGAAVMFALLILLIVPWGTRHDRLLRRLALLPVAAFLALAISIAFERDDTRDAVIVVQDVVLRSADSPGASPAFSSPLPGGAEVFVTERRDGWTRVRLASGVEGWVAETAVETVRPR